MALKVGNPAAQDWQFASVMRALYHMAKLEGSPAGSSYRAIPEFPCAILSLYWAGSDLCYMDEHGGAMVYNGDNLAYLTAGAGNWQIKEYDPWH